MYTSGPCAEHAPVLMQHHLMRDQIETEQKMHGSEAMSKVPTQCRSHGQHEHFYFASSVAA